jgi:sarcosine oxidase subunit alpha
MRRITDHPILSHGREGRRQVPFLFEGTTLYGMEGETIAAALTAAGVYELGYSHRFRKPRGIYCGIGQCQSCVMVVNGVPNIRVCVKTLAEGMRVERQYGRGKVP